MISLPQFSEFRPLRLQDRDRILEKFDTYQPETPELTFNNLFIWQSHYHVRWSMDEEWLQLPYKSKT